MEGRFRQREQTDRGKAKAKGADCRGMLEGRFKGKGSRLVK